VLDESDVIPVRVALRGRPSVTRLR